MMKLPLKFAPILLTLLLSGCSIFGPVKTEPPATYDLKEMPYPIHSSTISPITLIINTPDVSQAYNSTQMAYSTRRYQVSYYGLAAWVASPAQMLQPLLLQTLQDTHGYKAVVAAPFIGTYDYILDTHILEFIQDWTHVPPASKLLIVAQIIRVKTNRVIATKRIEIIEPINGKTPYAGARAMNHAVSKALKIIRQFVANRLNYTSSKRRYYRQCKPT